jgi:hypothetical protein
VTQTKEQRKAWYLANRESILAKRKIYQENNKDKLKEYREANKDRIKKYQAEYRLAHLDEFKEYNAENKLEHLDYFKEYSKEWNKENWARYSAPYRLLVQIPFGFDVHHLNHIHSDNSIDNLLPMSHANHTRYHNFYRGGNFTKAQEVLRECHTFYLNWLNSL